MSKVKGVCEQKMSRMRLILIVAVCTHSVEGSSIDGLVDLVGTSDRGGGEERDNLEWAETAGILEASKDRGNTVLRLGDQADDSGSGRIGAASQELDLRSTLCEGR